MKTFGEVRYPSYTIIQSGGKKNTQPEHTLSGWNRGKLIADPSCIIFEDVEGHVHVVKRDLFYS